MSTRMYLALLAVRLFFAVSPSYIHPDENFQGPEVIAGMYKNVALEYAALQYWSGGSGCSDAPLFDRRGPRDHYDDYYRTMTGPQGKWTAEQSGQKRFEKPFY